MVKGVGPLIYGKAIKDITICIYIILYYIIVVPSFLSNLEINYAGFYLFTVHGFLQTTYDVDEDERLDTMFQLNVKGTTPLSLVITGIITAAADGSASMLSCLQSLNRVKPL